jgi:hypothetical protein
MSIICTPTIRLADMEALVLLDPHRWRVTIWRGPRLLRRLHDKDGARIVRRARAWMEQTALAVAGEVKP